MALVLSCLAPSSLGAAERPDGLAAAVDAAYRPLLEKYDVPGMAVAVTAGGRSSFFAFGVASKKTGAPVTKDTIFELGSVSKTFTATLVGHAVALGRISLDDHPGEHMPALNGAPIDKASLIELGANTAGGLPLQFPEGVSSDEDIERYFQRWTPSAEPGVQRRYSNPSVGLAGYIAALAMKRDFASAMESEIFTALGLGHTHIRVPEAEMGAYAWGHDDAGRQIRVNPGPLDAEAYGVKSTAADMIRFVEANIRPELLDAPMRSAVEATHVGYFRVGEMTQGLGWEQFAYPIPLERLLAGNSRAMIFEAKPATKITPARTPSEPTLFDKTGSTNGFGAYVAFVPAKRIGVVMLANRSLPIAARITAAHAVLEALSSDAP